MSNLQVTYEGSLALVSLALMFGVAVLAVLFGSTRASQTLHELVAVLVQVPVVVAAVGTPGGSMVAPQVIPVALQTVGGVVRPPRRSGHPGSEPGMVACGKRLRYQCGEGSLRVWFP